MEAWWSWASFWSGLASTVIGIVIGVPVALWLAHYGAAIQEHARRTEEEGRLERALLSVAVAVRHNAERTRSLAESLQLHQVPFDAGVDISAWEATKHEIVPLLKDAELQRRIAHHFTRIETIRRLATLLLDQSVGVASALQDAPRVREALRTHLLNEAQAVSKEADALAGEIARRVSSHSETVGPRPRTRDPAGTGEGSSRRE